jgi:hypothetical protein
VGKFSKCVWYQHSAGAEFSRVETARLLLYQYLSSNIVDRHFLIKTAYKLLRPVQRNRPFEDIIAEIHAYGEPIVSREKQSLLDKIKNLEVDLEETKKAAEALK